MHRCRERKRRLRDRGSGRVRGGGREPEAEKDAERSPVNGVTQIDRWGRKQPWGETGQPVTHSGGPEEVTRRLNGPEPLSGGRLVCAGDEYMTHMQNGI